MGKWHGVSVSHVTARFSKRLPAISSMSMLSCQLLRVLPPPRKSCHRARWRRPHACAPMHGEPTLLPPASRALSAAVVCGTKPGLIASWRALVDLTMICSPLTESRSRQSRCRQPVPSWSPTVPGPLYVGRPSPMLIYIPLARAAVRSQPRRRV